MQNILFYLNLYEYQLTGVAIDVLMNVTIEIFLAFYSCFLFETRILALAFEFLNHVKL